MDAKARVHEIITRGERRQNLRYLLSFVIGAVCATIVTYILDLTSENKQLLAHIEIMKGETKATSLHADDVNKKGVTILRPLSF